MGLIVDVLRSAGQDCTNNGLSRHFNSLLVTNVDGPFDGHDRPRVHLVAGSLPGTVKLIPETDALSDNPRWTMFGGNYAATSDSRWCRAVDRIAGSPQSGAVPIHDRIEG
jgi:hypothetical protein